MQILAGIAIVAVAGLVMLGLYKPGKHVKDALNSAGNNWREKERFRKIFWDLNENGVPLLVSGLAFLIHGYYNNLNQFEEEEKAGSKIGEGYSPRKHGPFFSDYLGRARSFIWYIRFMNLVCLLVILGASLHCFAGIDLLKMFGFK